MVRKLLTVVLLLSAGLLSGCRNELMNNATSLLSRIDLLLSFNTGGAAAADTTPPTVLFQSPTGTGVGTGTTITVQFSEAMNTGTVTSATFQVNGGAVAGTVAYTAGNYVFTPTGALANNTTYTVTVTTGVTDLAGNAMTADHTWTFTTVAAGTVPAPAMSPPGGTYGAAQSVSITCSQATASIYYTLDGSTPTAASTLYTGAVTVSANTTVSAIAAEAGYADSAVTVEDYYIRTAQPSFSVTTGTYTSDQGVTITGPGGSTIYYEMTTGTIGTPPADPPDPTIASAVYSVPIDVTGDLTQVKIKAIALVPGMTVSLPVSVTVSIDYVQLGAPTFSVDPATGPFDADQSVTINHVGGSSVYYTIDGSDPFTFGALYDDSVLTVTDSLTIRAYATQAGYDDSPEATGAYIFNPSITSLSPNSGHVDATSLGVTIIGTRFKPLATVALKYGASTISPLTTTFVSSTQLNCTFDLTGATPTGYWSLVVTNTDTGATTFVDGFRIYDDPAGIVSWWKLDGDQQDSGPAENHGTGGATTKNDADRFGVSGGAISPVTVGSGYFKSLANGLPVGNSQRTMMGWFRLDALAGINQYLFGYQFFTTTQHSMLYVQTGTNRLIFNEDINLATITGRTALTTGRWYHAAVTYDGTTVTLYLDGMVEGTATVALSTTADRFYMFKRDTEDPSIYLDGALDDVMVLDNALTQAQVKEAAAYGGYLLPPTGLNPSKGTYSGAVLLSWNPSVDATGYRVYRSDTLGGAYWPIAEVTALSYVDDEIAMNTVYYYKVAALNATKISNLSKAEIGWFGDWMTYTDNFEGPGYAPWWTSGPTFVGDTSWMVDGVSSHSGGYGFHVFPSTCTGGCEFSQTIQLQRVFSPLIPYFSFSIWYYRGAVGQGEVRLYVNNPNPSDDTGLLPFMQAQTAPGWNQLTANYIGDVGIITLVFYDITDAAYFYADDIAIYTIGW